MGRFWDMICLSVSVMFVGGDTFSELPPPKSLNFIWETPFRLSLTWEKPEDLDHSCRVNYTVNVYNSQECSGKLNSKRVQTLGCKLEISNENGLCISVRTNPENCGQRGNSRPVIFSIAPPSVRLVKNRSCEYSHSKMKCTWIPVVDVQNLSLYYWLPRDESIKKCKPDETLKPRGCIIHDKSLKEAVNIFYLFNGTYNGTSVINTFKDERPVDYVKLNKPQLTIHRDGQKLIFQANGTDLDEFVNLCYIFLYTISKCSENITVHEREHYVEQYDPACKYRARVQVIFSQNCGAGSSDPSDEVEYVKLNKPQLTIHRDGQNLLFQANGTDLDEFENHCYIFLYTISNCNKNITVHEREHYVEQYDPACKYRARVQVIISNNCGAGSSDPSDEVEYGGAMTLTEYCQVDDLRPGL